MKLYKTYIHHNSWIEWFFVIAEDKEKAIEKIIKQRFYGVDSPDNDKNKEKVKKESIIEQIIIRCYI